MFFGGGNRRDRGEAGTGVIGFPLVLALVAPFAATLINFLCVLANLMPMRRCSSDARPAGARCREEA